VCWLFGCKQDRPTDLGGGLRFDYFPQAAEKIIEHPNSALLEGSDRCVDCQDAKRVKKNCWIILNDDGSRKGRRCAPCTRTGLTCRFRDEQPAGSGEAAARQRVAREETPMSNETWIFLGQMQTYAELLETVTSQLDEQSQFARVSLTNVSKGIRRGIQAVKEKNKEA
jgi:hypothetical protein